MITIKIYDEYDSTEYDDSYDWEVVNYRRHVLVNGVEGSINASWFGNYNNIGIIVGTERCNSDMYYNEELTNGGSVLRENLVYGRIGAGGTCWCLSDAYLVVNYHQTCWEDEDGEYCGWEWDDVLVYNGETRIKGNYQITLDLYNFSNSPLDKC